MDVSNAEVNGPDVENFQLSEKEIRRAEMTFFSIATKEVKHFVKEKDWKANTFEKDGILYYDGRILDGQGLLTLEKERTIAFCAASRMQVFSNLL